MAERFGTDKYFKHHYTPVYYDLLKDWQQTATRILEIGIGDEAYTSGGYKIGASLKMWEEFFPNAEIVGLDQNPKSLINEGRIRSFQCDQSNKNSLVKALSQAGEGCFDLILDDGSHRARDQALSAIVLLPRLRKNGIYVIEDVDDTELVCRQIPAGYITEAIFTGSNFDDKLIVIREATADHLLH